MIVDDDLEDLEIFEIALKEANPSIDLLKVDGGPEALEILRKNNSFPQYIFLDLNMRQMSGQDCIRELKNHDRFKHIRVIIYTTSSNDTEIHDLLSAGAERFITKPTSLTQLITILKEIADGSV